jgi:hypothetical protein
MECPGTTCFVFPESLRRTHPGLAQDLQFCLSMLEIPEVDRCCPRQAEADDFTYIEKSAA